jgi:hypothetical protein
MTQQTPFPSPQPRRESHPVLQPAEMRMILIAGADARSMREASMHLFEAGHMPVIGEWLSDPLVSLSGLDDAGDEKLAQIVRPLSDRLLARCDAVLRVPGLSPGADGVVGLARARGLRVFFSLKEALDG